MKIQLRMTLQHHRLAAIMFSDIVGYSKLMGSNEDKAFQILRKNRKLQKTIIAKYKGECLKEMGDGILASFSSASDAVRCAGLIQNKAKTEGISLRIGIHAGEVVFEGGDVLGDGVNVASRLQEYADVGGINISGAIYKEIKNKQGISTNYIEEKILKNIDDPVKIYKVDCKSFESENTDPVPKKILSKVVLYPVLALILATLILILLYYLPAPNNNSQKSIAVIGITNLSKNESDQHICDGMMEEIINKLASIQDLRVLPSEYVEKYINSNKTLKKISKEIQVDNLLRAGFRKYGNTINLTPTLYNVNEDKIIWTQSYEIQLGDILKIQNDIAQKVADELNILLSSTEKQLLDKIPETNTTAYQYYLSNSNNPSMNRNNGDDCSENITLILNWTNDPTFTGEYIALEKFWIQDNLEITILQGGAGINPINLVSSKQADFAVVGADKALQAIAVDQPISIISVDLQRNPVGWIVRSELNIRSFNDLLDHKDIILGNKSGTEISSILKLIIERRRFDLLPQAVSFDFTYFLTTPKVVYPVYLNEEPILAGLIHNIPIIEIDPSLPENGGIKLYGNVIITYEDKLIKCKDQVRRFINGLKAGWTYAKNNPDSALLIVNKHVLNDREYVRQVMQRTVDFATNRYGVNVEPGDMNREFWLETMDVLLEADWLSKKVNIDSAIYFY